MIPNNLFLNTGDEDLENRVRVVLRAVKRMKDVIEITRKIREHQKTAISKPLNKIIILHDDDR